MINAGGISLTINANHLLICLKYSVLDPFLILIPRFFPFYILSIFLSHLYIHSVFVLSRCTQESTVNIERDSFIVFQVVQDNKLFPKYSESSLKM